MWKKPSGVRSTPYRCRPQRVPSHAGCIDIPHSPAIRLLTQSDKCQGVGDGGPEGNLGRGLRLRGSLRWRGSAGPSQGGRLLRFARNDMTMIILFDEVHA